ncbi:MAG: Stk1 family PASTA domain-containing Ser/Thr kinase [Acidimicrobiia bacterium]|nr:Stk1 family PASTA domain-containing Ser/Thr kinase [Acidimicrobiia bacterium]
MSDAPYEVLAGRYELHRQLATGGSADVFLARDQLLNRPVAVKVLNATLSEDEAFVERLRREAQLVASLNHQNIVGVFDQGEQDGAPFIVMEYVNGRSLAEILRSEGRLHPDRAATIAVDVAAALDAAHRQGMVHMDVKPGNVLVTAEGQVKLADFGIAKALNEGAETDLTAEGGTVMGTATYLSPEQAQGQKVGPRSDVYSLAVVLYEMMTGRPPFIGDTPVEIARKHVEEAPQAPRRLGVDIAQSLEAITLKGLAKSPVNRYPSVRDFAADLKRYLAGAHDLASGAAAAAAGTAAAKPPVVRPVTGRSTPPEIEDATTIIPTTQSAAPAARPAAAPQQTAAAVPVATAPRPVDAVIEARPVVVRNDDTWKRNVLFFIALCILLLLLGFLARAFLDVLNPEDEVISPDDPTEETVTLSSFVNLDRDQAVSLIESQNLVPVINTEPNNDVEEGRVFKQDPPAGAIVALESIVEITVSEAEGKISVPTLVELTREEAERTLRRLGFTPDVQEVDNDIFSPGEVISQDPLPGVSADRGSVVFLEVSLGFSERTVPDLAGQTQTEALNRLFELDFRITQVEEADPLVEEGLVLRTDPPAGSLLRGREIVTVFVSSGVARKPVPSVIGLLADSARQQLMASGFEVQIDFIEVADPTDVNKVVDQTPPANIELREGESVRIIVGLEPPPEETTVPPTTPTTAATTTTTTTTTTTAAPG